MTPFFLYVGIPIIIGYLLSLFLLAHTKTLPSFYFRLFLSIGLGFGVCSCVTFLALLTFGLRTAPVLIAEAALIVILLALIYRSKAGSKQPGISDPLSKTFSVSRTQIGIKIFFFAALAFSVLVFLVLSYKNPHGGYDAFAIWNLRARFLFRAGPHWGDAFSQHLTWSHLDYPLLIPTSIARGWVVAGNDTVAVPAVLALLFTFGTVGLTVSSVSILRVETQGFLAGTLLLGTPSFISLGASQYADIPLSFFFLSSLVLLSLQQQSTRYKNQLSLLAGLSAGFAVWTKNEGLLFLLSLSLALLIMTLRSKEERVDGKKIGYLLLGAAPVLLLVLLFKIQIAPPNDLFFERSFSAILQQLSDPRRHLQVLTAFQREMRNFGGWPFSMPIMLLFYLLVVGVTTKLNCNNLRLLVTTLTSMVIGYYLVHIITPHDLAWHLQYSLDRVLLQLWPSMLFAYFMTVRSIGEAVTLRETNLAHAS